MRGDDEEHRLAGQMADVTDPTADGGAAGAPAPGRRRRPYFIPGVIAMVALLAMGVALGAGDLSHPAPTTLAGSDVASQIALGIQAAKNGTEAPVVSCPAKLPVRAGYVFSCRESPRVGGPQRDVQVTEIDGRGNLRWAFGS